MRQKGFSGKFNLILCIATAVALFVNSEVLGYLVSLIWIGKGAVKLFKTAAEGGVFD